MSLWYDEQRKEDSDALKRHVFPEQPRLARNGAAAAIIQPHGMNPLTVRLLMLDDNLRELINLESGLPNVSVWTGSGPGASFGAGPVTLTASGTGTDATVTPIPMPAGGTSSFPPPGHYATSSGATTTTSTIVFTISPATRVSVTWDTPRALRLTFECLFHLGSVLDRLAYEMTALYKSPPSGSWPAPRNIGWSEPAIQTGARRFTDPTSLTASLSDALSYRHRVMHDGYLILGLRHDASGGLKIVVEPNSSALVPNPPFPPVETDLVTRAGEWGDAVFAACSAVYDHASTELASGKGLPLNLP